MSKRTSTNRTGQYTKFIILTMPRSGSNLLSYLLDDHPRIASVGEAFCIERVWGSPEKPQYDKNAYVKLFRDTFPRLFLQYGLYHSYAPNVHAVGFRIFYHQLDHFKTIRDTLINDTSIRVVHLIRNNILEAITSLYLARKTNRWSSLQPNTHKITTVTIPFDSCKEYFSDVEWQQKHYHAAFRNHPTIRITYENIVKRKTRETDRVLSFLGFNKRMLSCSLHKQNTRDISQIVTNYISLKKRFSDTKWSRFFTT